MNKKAHKPRLASAAYAPRITCGGDKEPIPSLEECETATTTNRKQEIIKLYVCADGASHHFYRILDERVGSLAESTSRRDSVASGSQNCQFIAREIELLKKNKDIDDYGLPIHSRGAYTRARKVVRRGQDVKFLGQRWTPWEECMVIPSSSKRPP